MQNLPFESNLITAAQKSDAGHLVLALKGDICFDSAATLRTELFALLDAHKPKRLILNLAGVPYLGSGGFGVFIELLRRLPPKNGLILTNVHKNVQAVITVMKLSTILATAPDDAAALAL